MTSKHWLCLVAALALGACSDPLEQVPRLDDVDIADSTPQADALPDASAQAITPDTAATVAEADKPNSGFLGFLRRRADAAGAAPAAPQAEAPADTQVAALPPSTTTDAAPAPEPAPEAARKPRRGLFGGPRRTRTPTGARRAKRFPAPGAPDFEQIAAGTSLSYGRLGRLCDVPGAKLGAKVDSYPEGGKGYTLYDTKPGGTGLRTFYMTGFDDGCARQFTAALVRFAEPASYEQLHYSPAGKTLPKAATDAAYERVKAQVCKVKPGQPCGAKMSQLQSETFFVTVYERFVGSPRWKNMLVHQGVVEALDLNSR